MNALREKVGLLNSWKEIATYLGRAVRTVQRWEKVGLPVRRIKDGSRSPVIANARDIDVWVQAAQAHGFAVRQSNEQLLFRGALVESIQQARLLLAELVRLRESQRGDLTKLIAGIARLEKICAPIDISVTRVTPGRRKKKSSQGTKA